MRPAIYSISIIGLQSTDLSQFEWHLLSCDTYQFVLHRNRLNFSYGIFYRIVGSAKDVNLELIRRIESHLNLSFLYSVPCQKTIVKHPNAQCLTKYGNFNSAISPALVPNRQEKVPNFCEKEIFTVGINLNLAEDIHI